MASSDFLQAWQRCGITDHRACAAKTVVKIIDHKMETVEHWKNSELWQVLEAEGISISFLRNPCTLSQISIGGNKTIAEVEALFFFEHSFQQEIRQNPIAGAIAISHLRALNEALSDVPQAEAIIVLECDVEIIQNSITLIAGFIANWFGNKELEKTHYCALTFSDWHPSYSRTVRSGAIPVPGSGIQPYFGLQQLPFDKNKAGYWTYKFVGQGARALCYSKKFVEMLLSTRVKHYWDIHLLVTLGNLRCDIWKKDRVDEKHLAVIVTTPVFHHTPVMGDRFRGSGRLHEDAHTTAENISHYICISLCREWGLANRAQTICLVSTIAAMFNFGVYIVWQPKPACDVTFHQVLQFDETSEVFQELPFIRVFDSPNDSSWKAAMSNQYWKIMAFDSQCQVGQGLSWYFQKFKEMTEKHNMNYEETVIVPAFQAKYEEETAWKLLMPAPDACAAASMWLNSHRENGKFQVGVHVRRGDHRFLNCDERVRREQNKEKAEKLQMTWDEADREFEETCQVQTGCSSS